MSAFEDLPPSPETIFLLIFSCIRPQRRGARNSCRNALGEGGDHHAEGVGQHLEAALCGTITAKVELNVSLLEHNTVHPPF